MASDQLVDYALPRELYRVIKAYWKLFFGVLGHDEKFWDVCFENLSAARNRMAHGRDVAIDANARTIAEAQCQEIIDICDRRDRDNRPQSV